MDKANFGLGIHIFERGDQWSNMEVAGSEEKGGLKKNGVSV